MNFNQLHNKLSEYLIAEGYTPQTITTNPALFSNYEKQFVIIPTKIETLGTQNLDNESTSFNIAIILTYYSASGLYQTNINVSTDFITELRNYIATWQIEDFTEIGAIKVSNEITEFNNSNDIDGLLAVTHNIKVITIS